MTYMEVMQVEWCFVSLAGISALASVTVTKQRVYNLGYVLHRLDPLMPAVRCASVQSSSSPVVNALGHFAVCVCSR
ncbi:hypothetical protein DFP72DRAFT_911039 [Ephemerocybe angulata]|uniref:Uncharacterized protein n=1 Tax=Ephemerocybe angulata TaxID=980116 RepID=A0A8H6HNR1_9AGAR|nr:hypothetical protein DFP72DRAFT_911039 [Tulosesus angulatus]